MENVQFVTHTPMNSLNNVSKIQYQVTGELGEQISHKMRIENYSHACTNFKICSNGINPSKNHPKTQNLPKLYMITVTAFQNMYYYVIIECQ